MLDTAKALYTFYSSFNLPAYTVQNVPDDVVLPYLTYSYVEPDWDRSATHYVQIFMRTHSDGPLLEKAGEIVRAIGTGLRLPCENGGCVYLHLDSPIVQINVEMDSDIRYAYLNLQLDALHPYGQ